MIKYKIWTGTDGEFQQKNGNDVLNYILKNHL